MGLLDNLFKPKPETEGEKSVENSGAPDPGESHTPASKTSPFLAPKIYVPRSSVQIVPPARSQLQVELKPAPALEAPVISGEIVLTLGDVLPQIATQWLRPGMHDTRRELRFAAQGLAADIARGRAAVFLAEIMSQCPDIFLPEADAFDDTRIRLPLQKLVEQIGRAPASGCGAPAADRSRGAPAARPASESVPVEKAPAVEIPAPLPAPPPASEAPAREEEISLSLAVILKRCPKEIIVQPLPPIDEAVRITLPFPPIERQLATGQVEVSSLRFIAALPLGLMKCFEAKAGIKVSLPLEEIFQNLPGQSPSAGFAARFPAPAPEPDATAESRELAAKNAKLAEAILLEPMHEAPAIPEPAAPPALEPVENIISANFTAEPASEPVLAPAPAPEFHAPPGSAPEISSAPEPAKIEAPEMSEIKAEEAAMEAREPEPSPVEAAIFAEPKIAPEPPVEAVAESTPPVLPEPVAPAVEAPAFRRFVPSLPPPVLLKPGADFLRPQPAPAAPEQPEPPPVALEIPSKPPVDFEPDAPDLPPAFQPPPQTIAPAPAVSALAPAPVDERPAPEIPVMPLRIAPPHFRPVVVLPPIVAVAADAPPFIPQAAEPVPPPAISAPPANQEPEPLPELPPADKEPPAATRPISEPAMAFTEPAAPFLLDGRIPALFENAAPLALPRLGELLAALPGIKGCILTSRAADAHGGELPAGLDAPAVRELSRRMRGALADRTGNFTPGDVQHLTLHADHYSLTLFTRGEACVCAIHRARIFLPGVRERFAAVAEELARDGH